MRRFLLALLFPLALGGCGVVGGAVTLTNAQQLIADMKIGPSELKIVGAVDRADRRYRVGEPINLSVQVNKDARVAVLRVLPSGATAIVFPNRQHPDAAVAADAVLRIPEQGAAYTVSADKPGIVLFEFIASTRPGSWLFERKPAGSADFAELGATTRALARDIVTSLKIGRGPETAASHLTVQVEAP